MENLLKQELNYDELQQIEINAVTVSRATLKPVIIDLSVLKRLVSSLKSSDIRDLVISLRQRIDSVTTYEEYITELEQELLFRDTIDTVSRIKD